MNMERMSSSFPPPPLSHIHSAVEKGPLGLMPSPPIHHLNAVHLAKKKKSHFILEVKVEN